jgi:hypothetical protein
MKIIINNKKERVVGATRPNKRQFVYPSAGSNVLQSVSLLLLAFSPVWLTT